MESRPHFSVIIPTRNRPESLAQCIRSLAAQSIPKDLFEVIVVDDGSSPPVDPEILPASDRLRIRLLRQNGKGAAAARNAGADRAQGKYLAFTDDDCGLHADWLSKLAQVFDLHPDAAVTGKTLNRLTGNRYASAAQLLVDYLYAFYNEVPHRSRFLTSNNFALSASAFRAIGGFHTEFASAGGEDRELCDRWISRNLALVYSPEAITYHSHAMTLAGFIDQQFSYGKGAFHFNRLRSLRNGSHFAIEAPAFYLGMFRFPYRRQKLFAAQITTILFAISQGANLAGFAYENLSYRLRARN